jgi:hypothetical protein
MFEQTYRFTELEKLVDTYGIREVMYTLANVCTEKADHLATNWQDNTAAKVWDNRADKIAALAVNF